MKSKIINMVDRMKDKEDLKLESLFRSEKIADDGFSDCVVARVKRQIWIRRLTLPVAILIGGLIAAKPAAELLMLLPAIMTYVPEDLRIVPENLLPHVSTLVIGAALAGAMTFLIRTLED